MSTETNVTTAQAMQLDEGPWEYKIWNVYKLLKQKLKNAAERFNETSHDYVPQHRSVQNKSREAKTFLIVRFEDDKETYYTLYIPATVNVKECKMAVSEGLNIAYRNIKLFENGVKLSDEDKLQPEGCRLIVVEIGVGESETESDPEIGQKTLGEYTSAVVPNVDVQKVMMTKNDGSKKYIEVAIFRESNPRQYFGGYRNKRTGQEYYHKIVQTEYRGCAQSNLTITDPQVKKCTRETQTLLPQIDKGVNTLANKCVQVSRSGIYISAVTDKLIAPKPYREYNAVNKKMTSGEAVLILQRAWRRYINMKKVHQKYKTIHDTRVAKKQFKGSSLVEFHKFQISLLTRASFPTSRSDFYDLYALLGEWLRRQRYAVAEHKDGFARKVAMAQQQKRHIEGLQAIEGHRIQAQKENLLKQDIAFLEGTAKNRVRKYPKGNVTFIDDLNIKRARDLKEIFASYSRTDVSTTERIEILTNIKKCLVGFEEIDLTVDLIEILERETDLLQIGVEKKNLEYLRKRFESHYINFVKNPEINPQARYYKSSMAEPKKYAKYRCVNCQKILNPSRMFMHLRMSRFRTCTSCAYMHSTVTATINLAPYKRLLNSLRAAETEKGCRGAIPFLLQPMGMYFLVNVLWDGRSIIGGSSYLPGLKVTRWLPNEEWSMWNMILLTELEANKHEKLINPLDFYSKEFVLNVMNRNILGRIHFHMVADIDTKFRKREPTGILPKDHLLYTSKKATDFLPEDDVHPFLSTNRARFGGKTTTNKRDQGT